MLDKRNKAYFINKKDYESLKKELLKWDIVPEDVNGKYEFCIQSSNIAYTVVLYLEGTPCYREEAMQIVHSFEDIQRDLYGKVIWNWR